MRVEIIIIERCRFIGMDVAQYDWQRGIDAIGVGLVELIGRVSEQEN